MIYGLGSFSAAEQLAVLDGAHAVGFKVMYDLPTGPVHIQEGGPFDNVTMLRDLVGNVTLVKDHPALLGCGSVGSTLFCRSTCIRTCQ